MQRASLLREALHIHASMNARRRVAGHGVTGEALTAAGWPGQRLLPDAACQRVYTAIRQLRRMGLEGSVITQDDGYLIPAQVRVRRA